MSDQFDGVSLHTFLIDVVQPVPTVAVDDGGNEVEGKAAIRMTTYAVVAQTPDLALERVLDGNASEIVYQGDDVDRIVVGLELAKRN